MGKNIAPRVVNDETQKEIKPLQSSFNLDSLSAYNNYSSYDIDLTTNENLIINEKEEVYENRQESIIHTRLTPIGQYIAKYIIASDGEALYIVDQHAAAERINYEKFTKKFNDQSNWRYTDLLVPVIINLTKKESAILEENLYLLKQIGISIESFGETSFRITSIPTWISEVDDRDYLHELVEQIVSNNKISLLDLRIKVISTLACKASLKANKVLSLMEMQVLLNDLLKCENPYTCPHGRPTTIIYSTSELDKLFKRT